MISQSQHVDAPAATVHDLLTDVAAWPLWSPHLLRTEPASGHVSPGWRGRMRPWFGPATTMEVLEVTPEAGMRWRTRGLGHELRYDQRIEASYNGCEVTFVATVHGPAAALVDRVVGPLSAFGQRRRLRRLALLAQR